eukprot:scaffold3762_cov118-Isochrysis_galbana.AAC.13
MQSGISTWHVWLSQRACARDSAAGGRRHSAGDSSTPQPMIPASPADAAPALLDEGHCGGATVRMSASSDCSGGRSNSPARRARRAVCTLRASREPSDCTSRAIPSGPASPVKASRWAAAVTGRTSLGLAGGGPAASVAMRPMRSSDQRVSSSSARSSVPSTPAAASRALTASCTRQSSFSKRSRRTSSRSCEALISATAERAATADDRTAARSASTSRALALSSVRISTASSSAARAAARVLASAASSRPASATARLARSSARRTAAAASRRTSTSASKWKDAAGRSGSGESEGTYEVLGTAAARVARSSALMRACSAFRLFMILLMPLTIEPMLPSCTGVATGTERAPLAAPPSATSTAPPTTKPPSVPPASATPASAAPASATTVSVPSLSDAPPSAPTASATPPSAAPPSIVPPSAVLHASPPASSPIPEVIASPMTSSFSRIVTWAAAELSAAPLPAAALGETLSMPAHGTRR